jgi:uncharacterized protein (TIGR02001 family)
MKRILLNSLALTVLSVHGVAMAADAAPVSPHTFTSNVGLVSDYLHRGISQSGQKGAIQGGFDYTHSSGLYVGLWGSSISWVSDRGLAINAGLELDNYFGFKSSIAGDITYDIGFVRYNYPTGYYVTPRPLNYAKADTNEMYGLIGYKWITAKYFYSLGDTFAVTHAQGSSYIDLNASYPIPDNGITLSAHYGKQTFKGAAAGFLAAAGTDPSYSDYKLSVTRDLSGFMDLNLRGFIAGLAYSSTNASTAPGAFYKVLNSDLGRATVVLSLSRTL